VADPTARTGGVTPMMRQYRDLKQRYPDYLLLFRLGDFYELFLEDAELGARLLQITLTSRQGSPMAGIPHHAAEVYIARLIRAGQKVALCEQLEAPGKGKKLLKRDVVRLITPGTITDTAFLAGSANNGAHAANGLTAMFIATGQDVANVSESHAGVVYNQLLDNGDFYWSITLTSLIVATYGGGTGLATQRECLEMLDCYGKGKANKFAEICAGVVLAGETSLSSAILAGDWVSSHDELGRNRPQ